MDNELFKKEFPPLTDDEMDDRTKKAISLMGEIAARAENKKWEYVILSGFAIDAHFGYISRNHKDVDMIIDRNDINEVRSFLEEKDHLVCESKWYNKDLLRVDPIDKESARAAHCDIHVSFFDKNSKEVVIPMGGKEIRFSGSYNDISIEKEFLGVKIKVLLPDLLIEEKKGWLEKIGLVPKEGREEKNALEIEKIQRIISLSKN